MNRRPRLELIRGDITDQSVDAVVNAANSELLGGSGVNGAIRRAGGPQIEAECDQIRRMQGRCPTGSAVATSAGRLPARYVFHAVGPIWSDHSPQECDRLLAGAYRKCMELAVQHSSKSIAFPSISTGVYGFPIARAAPIALETVASFPADVDARFVLFSTDDLAVYQAALEKLGR